MILTKEFKNGVKVHAIQTGEVIVKKEHFKYSRRINLERYCIKRCTSRGKSPNQ